MSITPEQKTTVVTFNVGLVQGFVPFADERVEAIAGAIASLDADVVCLQEVWLNVSETEQWSRAFLQRIIDASQDTFPYHYAGLEGLSSAAMGDESSGPQFFSNGHHGLLILSRRPFQKTACHCLPSTLIQRAVLHARIELAGLGETDVFCTHLAADLSHIIPYPGGRFQSFAQEHRYQIEEMLAWVEKTAATDQVILAGDFNCGPQKAQLQAELPENYMQLIDSGWSSPYIELQKEPPCTFCGTNPFNENVACKVIDHIFTRMDKLKALSIERVLDRSYKIKTLDDEKHLPLSDHYGIKIEFVKFVQG